MLVSEIIIINYRIKSKVCCDASKHILLISWQTTTH